MYYEYLMRRRNRFKPGELSESREQSASRLRTHAACSFVVSVIIT